MSNSQHTNRTCPSLGLRDDSYTSLAFPSVWNCCHRARPIVPPILKHQGEFCLSEKYQQCPVFLKQQTGPLSEHIRAPRSRVKKFRGFSHRNTAIALVSLGVIFLLGWGFMTDWSFPLAVTDATPTASITTVTIAAATPLPTETAAPTPTRTHIATVTDSPGKVTVPPTSTTTRTSIKTPAFTHTATLVPTAFSTVSLSKHQLEVPIGTNKKFVIHKVLIGESLSQYADEYNTSLEAIVMINYDLWIPLWVDKLVIIPLGFTEVANLPTFEAYEVTKAGKSLETLAQELGVAVDDLKYYNAIGTAESLLVGDWLLIPRPRPTP